MRSGADKRDESVKQGESRGSTTVNERKSFTGWPVAGDQVQARWLNVCRQVESRGSTTVNERKSFTGWPVAGDQVQARWENVCRQGESRLSTTVNERKSFTGCQGGGRGGGWSRQGDER